MIVTDALGRQHAFPAGHKPTVLPTGVLEVRDADGDLVAIFAAGGWISVIEEAGE